ncbi:hypothetical protein Tco_0795657 [Tanacetum coccineum]
MSKNPRTYSKNIMWNLPGKSLKIIVSQLPKELHEGLIIQIDDVEYTLTVNPTIYTLCIKQFWATAKAKTVNGEVQIQALVDGKKVIVTKTSVRRALQLKDAEGTECLPNATIFAELERMRLRKVGRTARIESSEDEGLGDQEDASKQRRKIVDLDADAENGITTTKMSTPVTAEEKTKKKNDVKARAIDQENSENSLEATERILSATSAESLDSIFNRLQKIVSRLAILGVIIAQEDLNLKFLSSLPPEWNTHVAVWINKPEIETMSIDDLRYHQEELYTHNEEIAPMALLDSEVKTCSKTCLTNYETLKKQYDDLVAKKHETEFKAITYKRGLDTVEAQLVTYGKNEVLFSEEVVVLKREVGIKQYEINTLKKDIEKLKQEKDAIDFKIEKFGKASKDLDQLLRSQITDKSKKGFGYSYRLRANKSVCENSSNETKKNYDAPLIEEWVSDNEDEVESPVMVEKKTVVPTIPKVDGNPETELEDLVSQDKEFYLETEDSEDETSSLRRIVEIEKP